MPSPWTLISLLLVDNASWGCAKFTERVLFAHLFSQVQIQFFPTENNLPIEIPACSVYIAVSLKSINDWFYVQFIDCFQPVFGCCKHFIYCMQVLMF